MSTDRGLPGGSYYPATPQNSKQPLKRGGLALSWPVYEFPRGIVEQKSSRSVHIRIHFSENSDQKSLLIKHRFIRIHIDQHQKKFRSMYTKLCTNTVPSYIDGLQKEKTVRVGKSEQGERANKIRKKQAELKIAYLRLLHLCIYIKIYDVYILDLFMHHSKKSIKKLI